MSKNSSAKEMRVVNSILAGLILVALSFFLYSSTKSSDSDGSCAEIVSKSGWAGEYESYEYTKGLPFGYVQTDYCEAKTIPGPESSNFLLLPFVVNVLIVSTSVYVVLAFVNRQK